MIYQRLTVSLFVVLLLPCAIAAQRSKPTPQIDNELWRVRAQTLTNDVLKDASDLNSVRRALVWSKLAELWWLQDQRRARTWLTNAVEVVEQVPNRESPEERQQRLGTAKSLLAFTSRVDQKLSQRLITLVSDVNESTSELDRNGTANSLIHAAIGIADRDPKRAAELGSQALRVGIPGDITDLLLALRGRDAKLADALFAQALSVAREKLDSNLLDSLTYAAFPRQKGVSDILVPPPDNLRAELLRVDVAFVNTHMNELPNGNWCFAVGAFITPVLPEFDRLLPQQALLVRQTVQKCRNSIATGSEQIDNPAGTEALNIIDALLKAAADTDVIPVRTQYQYRAARLAKDQGDYDRAIKILDSMSNESREIMQGSWEAYHWDWAASAALDHFQHGRVVEMNEVLNAVPAKLQPFAKMAFLDRLPTQKHLESVPAIQFLNDAGTGLSKSDISELEKYDWYFGLLKLTLRYQPSDAIAVLKESIASLNRAITKDSKFYDSNRFTEYLPATLLEIDEFAVKEILASVSNVEARSQLRLALLRKTLDRAQ